MRSGNPDVYARPGGRTEQEAAAEACVRLLESDLLPCSARLVADMAEIVGVAVEVIREMRPSPSRLSPLSAKPVNAGRVVADKRRRFARL